MSLSLYVLFGETFFAADVKSRMRQRVKIFQLCAILGEAFSSRKKNTTEFGCRNNVTANVTYFTTRNAVYAQGLTKALTLYNGATVQLYDFQNF